jgi:hypothetical protein
MGDLAKVFVAGVVTIGLVTAFGLHASGLSQLTKTGFKGASDLEGTAIKG